MSFDLSTLDRPFVEPGVNLDASLPEGMTPAEFVELKARLHERLVKELDPNRLSGLPQDEIEQRVRPVIGKAESRSSSRVPHPILWMMSGPCGRPWSETRPIWGPVLSPEVKMSPGCHPAAVAGIGSAAPLRVSQTRRLGTRRWSMFGSGRSRPQLCG